MAIRTRPTGSPCQSPVTSVVTSAPARRSTSKSATRVGFRPTSSMSIVEPGRPAAATAVASEAWRFANRKRALATPATMAPSMNIQADGMW